jgi:Domain of unknown function (DUF4375)
MAQTFDQLLAGTDDEALCNKAYDLIDAYYGPDLDASAIPDEERVVLLTLHTSGLIGNGGFRRLLEGNLQGDPDFALSAEAFQIIDCDKAAAAFRNTLALFPQSRPPRDIEKRLIYYLKRCKHWPTDEDNQFWDANKGLPGRLAAYIRSHADAYRHLQRPSTGRKRKEAVKIKAPPKSAAKDGGTKSFLPQWVQTVVAAFKSSSRKPRSKPFLPHWARVALAARCASRVAPQFTFRWPDAPKKHVKAIRIAIDLAERSASEGRPMPGLEEAAMNATMASGAALGAGSDFLRESPAAANAYDATLASKAARAALKAAEAALGSVEESRFSAMEAWDAAKSAASETDLLKEMEADSTVIYRAAQRGNWTDRTPVSKKIWERQ